MGEAVLCNTLAEMLCRYGIREAVASPGSRNAPLIAAISSRKDLRLTMVVDERSAAFVALGKAKISGLPVALICTSGSAVLNYAPALAEAYYSNIPLIVISADRPAELIDRNNGQTIRQCGSLRTVTKGTYSLDSRAPSAISEVIINDALASAVAIPGAPIHINVAIQDPTVVGEGYLTVNPRIIRRFDRDQHLSTANIREIAERVTYPNRVMIVAGSCLPDEQLNRALSRLASFGNFVILSEVGSNLHGHYSFTDIESLVSFTSTDILLPDIVITFGAPILSKKLRDFVSQHKIEHWHVGLSDCAPDVFSSLTLRIETYPATFFRQLAAGMRRPVGMSNYSAVVTSAYRQATYRIIARIAQYQWCEISAMKMIFAEMPPKANIQLSNGLTIRYAQHFNLSRFHRCDCNRGVSGIDGSTSTAVGAATLYNNLTVLLTGDMSARYDIGALGLRCVPTHFRVIVFCNGGGQIFKTITATRSYSEVDICMAESDPMPIVELARAWGYRTFSATSFDELNKCLPQFFDETTSPALLAVFTDCETDILCYNNLFKPDKI